MSSNRLMYDTCEYQTRLNESTGPLAYNLDPVRYENCNKCRMDLGVIGGTAVSHIRGNLVDLETEKPDYKHYADSVIKKAEPIYRAMGWDLNKITIDENQTTLDKWW